MKKNSTPIKSTILCVLMSACLFLSGTNMQAQIVFDYVADTDGNWSDDATWKGGTSPGDSVGESHIKIEKNVTVTLDVSVTVDGNDSSLSKVFINEGTIDGTGRRLVLRNTLFRGRKPLVGDKPLIKVDTIVFGKGTNYKFDGLLKCHDLVNRGGKVIVDSGKIMVRDNLILQKGCLIIHDTAKFRVSDSINVRLKGGRIINRSGTPLIGVIPRMMFDQRMDSLKALAPRIHHVDINLPGKADSVVLAEDIEIDSLILNRGILRLKDKKLVVTGKFTQDSGLIAGSVKARMVIQGTGDPIRLKMEKGKRKLKMLHIAREVILDDSLSIADTLELDKDAILELTKGVLIVNGKAKIAKGKLRGSKHAAIQFKKGELLDTLTFEANKDSLKELVIDHMDGELPLGSDLNVADKLVNHGKVHLGKHRLILHKHYQANKGKFVGDKEGIIIVKGNGDIDTIVFDSAKAHLKTLKLERDTNKPVMLGSHLEIDSLVDLTKGKIKLTKGMLRLHKKAKFAHVDSNNYIVITPGAKLARRPDSLKHPILFPVGNDSIYTPAELIQKSGSDTNEFSLAISDRVRAGGETGNDISHTRIVKKTWHIETQGVNITVQIKIVWSITVEDNGFNRDRCYISHYHGGKWDTVPSQKAVKEGTQYYVMRDSITSFSPFTVMSEESSGTPNLYTDEVFEMYPNPVDQTLTLQVEKTGNYLEIYNVTGTKVMQKVIDNQLTEIDLNNLKSGIYFVSYNGMMEKLIVR